MADRTRVFVPQMARVYLAPVGTAAPAGPLVIMPTGWFEVGLFTPDSLGWSTSPSFEEVKAHQSNYAVRRFQTEDSATLEVDLLEWSAANFKAVYGGGTVTKVTPGAGGGASYFKFSPPQVGGRSSVSACMEVSDGDRKYRRIIPVAEQSEGVEQKFNKTAESTLPLRLSVLGSDIGDAYYDMTNDPAFDEAA